MPSQNGPGGQNPYGRLERKGNQNGYDDGSSDAGRSYEQRRRGGGDGPGGGARSHERDSGSNVEMSAYGEDTENAPVDPNAVMNDCRDVERTVHDIESGILEDIRVLQNQVLQDTDTSAGSGRNRQLDGLMSEIMQQYRALTDRVRRIKGHPDAGSSKNRPHVERVDRRLRAAINQFQVLESDFRRRTQDQMARQYRIVRPDASETEVRAAVEDPSGPVFSQALMQSDRRGQSRAVLREVEDRQRALQKIEQSMVELSQLFVDLDTAIVRQEATVLQIEQQGEEIVENLDKGNDEIGQAVVTARSTRKKKWICLGISILILVIIGIVLAIYFTVINPLSFNNYYHHHHGPRPSLPDHPPEPQHHQPAAQHAIQKSSGRVLHFFACHCPPGLAGHERSGPTGGHLGSLAR